MSVTDQKSVDVAVVGTRLAGLSTARAMKAEGREVAVPEGPA